VTAGLEKAPFGWRPTVNSAANARAVQTPVGRRCCPDIVSHGSKSASDSTYSISSMQPRTRRSRGLLHN
jgi:hypothetical protein